MSEHNQIWTREDLETVNLATVLLHSAQVLIGHDDGLARALLDDAIITLSRATGAFAQPVQLRQRSGPG